MARSTFFEYLFSFRGITFSLRAAGQTRNQKTA
jgi:hypothetical protein